MVIIGKCTGPCYVRSNSAEDAGRLHCLVPISTQGRVKNSMDLGLGMEDRRRRECGVGYGEEFPPIGERSGKGQCPCTDFLFNLEASKCVFCCLLMSIQLPKNVK